MAKNSKKTARKIQLTGNILGIIGNYMDSRARAKALEQQSLNSVLNAYNASIDIETRKKAGKQERDNVRLIEEAEKGSARAGYAAGNVDVSTGIAFDVNAAIADQARRQRQASAEQESIDVMRSQLERDTLLSESKLLRRAARSARYTGVLNATAGAFSAGASYGSK